MKACADFEQTLLALCWPRHEVGAVDGIEIAIFERFRTLPTTTNLPSDSSLSLAGVTGTATSPFLPDEICLLGLYLAIMPSFRTTRLLLS